MHTPRAILPVASASPHGRIALKSGLRWLLPLLLASGFLWLACPGALAGTMTCTYDDNGRLLSTDDGAGATQAFTYDQAGNITNVLSISPDNTLRVFISPQGTGSVAAEGVSCPGDCSHQYPGAPYRTLAPSGAAG